MLAHLTSAQVAHQLGVDPKKLRRALRRDGRWSAPYLFTDEDLLVLARLLGLTRFANAQRFTDVPGRPADELLILKQRPELRALYRSLTADRVSRLHKRLDALGLLGRSESNPDQPPASPWVCGVCGYAATDDYVLNGHECGA